MDKSDSDGTALLVATDCADEITMCMNMTVMDTDKKITGTIFFLIEWKTVIAPK